jgi:hypothetical protein
VIPPINLANSFKVEDFIVAKSKWVISILKALLCTESAQF